MKITVLGGGHGCYASAVEMAEKSHEVKLWRRDQDSLKELAKYGELTVKDFRGTRTVSVGDDHQKIQLETDLSKAIENAELIIIPLPATSHEDLAIEIAPYLTSGQVVFLPPGTFGTYLFAQAMLKVGNKSDVAFAETGTLPYLVRKHSPNSIVISVYATRLPTGVYPAKLKDHAIRVLKQAYDSIEPIEDALSGALMNAGPIIHPPLIMLNAAPLEHFDVWDIHNEGTQPSVRRVTSLLDQERMNIREALGYSKQHFPLADHYNKEGEGDEWMYGRGAHGKLTDSGDWREKIDLHSHRYMLEDTRLGLSFIVSVGKYVGVKTPIAEGLLNIASSITGRDLYSEGRTLENLGLFNLTQQQLKDLLNSGEQSA